MQNLNIQNLGPVDDEALSARAYAEKYGKK